MYCKRNYKWPVVQRWLCTIFNSLIALSEINIVCFSLYNLFIFICGFFAKVTRAIFLMINNGEIHRNKHDVIFHIFNQVKVLSLKGTVLYRVCMDGHLKYAIQSKIFLPSLNDIILVVKIWKPHLASSW